MTPLLLITADQGTIYGIFASIDRTRRPTIATLFAIWLMTTLPLAAQCNPNEVLAGAAGGQIHALDPTTGATTLLTTSPLVGGFVNALAANPDNRLAYYGDGTTIFAWDADANTHANLGGVAVAGTLASGAAGYADGHLYIGTEAGNTLRVYDVPLTSDGRGLGTAAILFTFNGDWGDMVVVGDTLYLASSTALMSYDLATSTGPTTINAATSNGVNFQLAATADERLFTVIFPSNEIREIDPATGNFIGATFTSSFPVSDLSGPSPLSCASEITCIPSGALAGGPDGEIWSIDLDTGLARRATTSTIVTGFVNALASNRDDGLAYYGTGNTIHYWDFATDTHQTLGTVIVTGTLTSGAATYLNDTLYIGTQTAGGTLNVYSVPVDATGTSMTGAANLLFSTPGDWGDLLAIEENGETILYMANGQALESYNVTTTTGPTTINPATSTQINFQLAGTFDGRLFIGEFPSNTVREIDPATGQNIGPTYSYSFNIADMTGPSPFACRPAKIGSQVWNDRNSNGTREGSEPGLPGVVVNLLDANGQPTGETTMTDATGNYRFCVLPGTYIVEFVLPADTTFSAQGVGTPGTDSDANPTTGRTAPVTVTDGSEVLDLDAGICLDATLMSVPCGFSTQDPVLTMTPIRVGQPTTLSFDSDFPFQPGIIYIAIDNDQVMQINGCNFTIRPEGLLVVRIFNTDGNGDYTFDIQWNIPASLNGLRFGMQARVCAPGSGVVGPFAPLPDLISNGYLGRIGCP